MKDKIIGRKYFKKLNFSILEGWSKWIIKFPKVKITVVLERLRVIHVSSGSKKECPRGIRRPEQSEVASGINWKNAHQTSRIVRRKKKCSGTRHEESEGNLPHLQAKWERYFKKCNNLTKFTSGRARFILRSSFWVMCTLFTLSSLAMQKNKEDSRLKPTMNEAEKCNVKWDRENEMSFLVSHQSATDRYYLQSYEKKCF